MMNEHMIVKTLRRLVVVTVTTAAMARMCRMNELHHKKLHMYASKITCEWARGGGGGRRVYSPPNRFTMSITKFSPSQPVIEKMIIRTNILESANEYASPGNSCPVKAVTAKRYRQPIPLVNNRTSVAEAVEYSRNAFSCQSRGIRDVKQIETNMKSGEDMHIIEIAEYILVKWSISLSSAHLQITNKGVCDQSSGYQRNAHRIKGRRERFIGQCEYNKARTEESGSSIIK
jgi:hypothetical protein